VDLDSNLAFSPLGYSVLLAILAEGAGGETRDQVVNALHLPEDHHVTRVAYRAVLQRLNVSNDLYKKVHPKLSGLAAWSENCKW
jgi:serine protease inhibitor